MILPVLLEGPYGHPQPLHIYETQVLIAGGVGITAILGYLQAFVDSPRTTKTKRMIIVWSAREADFIRTVAGSLLSNLPENVNLQLHCTGDKASELDAKYTVAHARPQLSNVVKSNVEALPAGERIAFLVSGSGSISDEVRQAVVECIGTSAEQVDGDRVNFFDEVFAW
jgi:ferredoxin-NADP reductase